MISALLSKYALPTLAALLAVALAAVAVQTARVGKFKAEARAATDEVTQLVAAAESTEKTIKVLTDATRGLAEEAQRQLDAANLAASRLAERDATIRKQAADLAAAEATEYDKPDCQALLALDIAGSCPAHADGVRQRARRDLQGPAR
jgi:hypothetical protein